MKKKRENVVFTPDVEKCDKMLEDLNNLPPVQFKPMPNKREISLYEYMVKRWGKETADAMIKMTKEK